MTIYSEARSGLPLHAPFAQGQILKFIFITHTRGNNKVPPQSLHCCCRLDYYLLSGHLQTDSIQRPPVCFERLVGSTYVISSFVKRRSMVLSRRVRSNKVVVTTAGMCVRVSSPCWFMFDSLVNIKVELFPTIFTLSFHSSYTTF